TASAWRYKICYRDSCGNLSPKSLYHKTIFIQNSGGNFSWNDYQIEGQPVPVPTLSNYIFRRDNNATGNWQNIQTLSAVSTAYTDPNYSLYTLTADWRTETVWSISCSSSYFKTAQTTATIKRSKSNVSNNRMIGIKEIDLTKAVMIYPNPVSGLLHVNTEELNAAYDLTLENAIGQVVYHSKSNTGSMTINTSDLAKGFYSLKLQTASGRITKKVIVE
ncbi:MAG: T9SS type A sorting domain-containing protein, partial [Bacteroidia bacterium]